MYNLDPSSHLVYPNVPVFRSYILFYPFNCRHNRAKKPVTWIQVSLHILYALGKILVCLGQKHIF